MNGVGWGRDWIRLLDYLQDLEDKLLLLKRLTSAGEALETQPVRKTLDVSRFRRGDALCRSRKFLTLSSVTVADKLTRGP